MMDEQPDSQSDPDIARMLAVREGDEVAFRELFQEHAPRLVGYADRFFHNRALSEELVQEVFLKVWRARRRYEPRAKFTTWLYTIASRACLNELRRGRHRREVELLDEARAVDGGGQERPDQLVEGARLQRAVQQALDRMPDNQRAALVLTRFGGHSYTEAAALLEVSESALKSLVFRAASAIRQVIEAQADSTATPELAGGAG